jgi:hypothetical protein
MRHLVGRLTRHLTGTRRSQSGNGAISFGLLAGAGLVDHPFEKATYRNPEARRLGLDPGATLVVEPDANNGGLGRRHDPVNSNPECLHQRAQNGGSQVVASAASDWPPLPWSPHGPDGACSQHPRGTASGPPEGRRPARADLRGFSPTGLLDPGTETPGRAAFLVIEVLTLRGQGVSEVPCFRWKEFCARPPTRRRARRCPEARSAGADADPSCRAEADEPPPRSRPPHRERRP